MEIRPMIEKDLGDVDVIQGLAYSEGLIEPIEVLLSRLRMAPRFCYVAVSKDESVVGYVIGHPWRRDHWPGLGAVIRALPEEAEVVHLHDLAVRPEAGGRGVARRLVSALLEETQRQGYGEVTLVAVQGARGFWERMDFAPVRSVEGYDDEALLMSRPV